MTLRHILVQADNSAPCGARVRTARAIAERFDATAVGLPCMTTALMQYPYSLVALGDTLSVLQDVDREAADRARRTFEEGAAGAACMAWEHLVGQGPWGFIRRAFYADLLVLGQPDPDEPLDGRLPADFLSSVLMESGRPALVLPYVAGPLPDIGRTVLVAWKETAEAARALAAAWPWLARAAAVHVVSYGDGAAQALGRVQALMAAHGVSAKVHDGGVDEADAGERLLSLAADLDAGLLVMGCYGHSRAREWMFGGVTRTLLASTTVPLLMAS
ncbi:MAG: universal stress protein [Pseudomonadota bacterium]|nr:universal stress protein [Pseudomonadota bacterium]MDQ7998241.1 universal stress protein [Pseudomonadota bacterium]MDQ8017084.1 universal stress protein [Pseudomonadota bacterium]